MIGHENLQVSTKESREILPKNYSIEDTIHI